MANLLRSHLEGIGRPSRPYRGGGARTRHQVAAKWLPLFGITYDAKDDLLKIAMEGLDHLIHKPREIAVVDGPSGLGSMEIVDSDRRRQIVKLMEPLLLPPPGSGRSAAPKR